jgi:hypothetical protein
VLAWAVFGIALGPGALLVAWLAPPAACVACGTPTVGWLRRCAECGANVRTGFVKEPATEQPALSRTGTETLSRRGKQAIEATAGTAATRSATAGTAAARSATARSATARTAAARSATGGKTVARKATAGTSTARPAATGTGGRTGATAGPARARPQATDTTEPSAEDGPVALATGVYAGGSIGLEIGHRYTIARSGEEIVIVGPVETAPTAIAHRRDLVRIDPVGVDDRLVITGTDEDRGRYLIRFQAVAGMVPEELELRLAPSAARPAPAARGPRARTRG